MSRIADALDRESRSVDLEPGDFERMLGRRERKQRNRRIREGVIAIIVALAVAALLLRSINPKDVPADRLVPPAAVPGTLTYALDGDIFVADPDGSNALRVANGRSDNQCSHNDGGENYSAEGPMWSPDGRYLAYRYWGCSKPESTGVVISDVEGNVLARIPSSGWQIAWSPDSTRVAVWDTFDYEGPSTIGVYGLDGTRQAQLAMPPAWRPSGDHDPAWMPDGTGVWVDDLDLPLDGGPPGGLPAHGDPYATYSPDGSLIAFNGGGSLWVARSDGTDAREVVQRSVGGADNWGYPWSPTGDHIAFTTRVRGSSSVKVGVVDVATGSVRILAEGEPGATLRAIGFSPSGDRVLFSSTATRTFESSLWSVGLDGSDARLVIDGTWQGEWLH